MAEPGFVKVAEVGDISAGEMMLVEVGEERVLLANIEGTFYACDDICSHAYASLAEGDLSGEEVECPLHGSAFSVITGEALTPPADEGVRVFQLRIDGQDIMLGPPQG